MARYFISGNTISIEGTGEARIVLPSFTQGLLVNTADTITRVSITTGSGNDTLNGSLGNDSLFGGDGNDEIRGGQGIDTLQGGLGSDIFRFLDSDFGTSVDFRAEADQDTINDFVSGSDRISFLQRNGASSSNFVFKFRSLPSVPGGQSFDANDLIFDQSTRTLRGFLAPGSTPNFTIFLPNTPNLVFTDILGAIDLPTVTIVATDSLAKEPLTSTSPSDPGVFTVTRSGGDLSQPLTVNYTIGGTATNGTDYTSISSSVVIPIGQSSTTITINPLFDGLIEGNETVILTLASNVNYTIGSQNTATVTIEDSTVILPTVTIVATDPTATEPSSSSLPPTDTGLFTITRSGGDLSQPLTVNYTIGGTATNGTDYTSISSSVVIPIGQSSTTITINPLFDGLIEGNETVTLTLASNVNYTIGAPNTATVTIADFVVTLGNNITGTSNDDVIDSTSSAGVTGTPSNFSTNFNDTINGLDGNDRIFGLGGDDIINGGDGRDTIFGGDGNDTIDGGDDKDTLTGGSGADIFQIDDSDGDVITDFNLSEGDVIQLLAAAFPGGIGTLPSLPGVFIQFNPATPLVEGDNSPFTSETRPTYVYNSSNGKLLLDADGSGTSSTFVVVAQLPSGLSSGIFDNISIVSFF
ncbi:MAG: Calx-beta domain-containing protein [Pseudanabaenaceae cyanobacterium]